MKMKGKKGKESTEKKRHENIGNETIMNGPEYFQTPTTVVTAVLYDVPTLLSFKYESQICFTTMALLDKNSAIISKLSPGREGLARK